MPKKGKQGESRGQARGKQVEKRSSRFFAVQTDPIFATPAVWEIAQSQAFIILKREKTYKNGSGKEGGTPRGK